MRPATTVTRCDGRKGGGGQRATDVIEGAYIDGTPVKAFLVHAHKLTYPYGVLA